MPMSTVATKERGSKVAEAARQVVGHPRHAEGRVEGEQKAAAPAERSQDRHRVGAGSRPRSTPSSALPVLAESRRRLLAAANGDAASGRRACGRDRVRRRARDRGHARRQNGGGPHGRSRWRPRGGRVLTVGPCEPIASSDGHATTRSRPRLGLGAARALPPPRGRDPLRGRSDRRARSAAGSRRAGSRRPSSRRRAGWCSRELHGEFSGIGERDATPEERVRRERRELGIDHALVGRGPGSPLGLPPSVAAAIERHHSPKASGHAAAIRLADLVVHYASGDPVPPASIVEAAAQLGLERDAVIGRSSTSSRTRAR